MPTYNSVSTISLSLDSIARQNFERAAIEILVIDGGSSDDTREVARSFGCIVLDNPMVQPEAAKVIGLQYARAKYVMFLDSDEVLVNPASISAKYELLESHPEVKNVITAGLRNPPEYPSINEYANRFGEPFSYFMYRLDGGDYERSLATRYRVSFEDQLSLIVRFAPGDTLPICDGGGHFFDLTYLKTIADISDHRVVPTIFNRMGGATRHLALVKGDFTVHYSNTSLRGYLSKLRWRIVNNVRKDTGTEGFRNRELLSPAFFRVKQYLFLPYALSLAGPIIDAIWLALSQRNAGLLIHAPLSVYTAGMILWQYTLKFARAKRKSTAYGA